MKVVIKIPIPGSEVQTFVEATGSPEEVAKFLKLWLTQIESEELPKPRPSPIEVA